MRRSAAEAAGGVLVYRGGRPSHYAMAKTRPTADLLRTGVQSAAHHRSEATAPRHSMENMT